LLIGLASLEEVSQSTSQEGISKGKVSIGQRRKASMDQLGEEFDVFVIRALFDKVGKVDQEIEGSNGFFLVFDLMLTQSKAQGFVQLPHDFGLHGTTTSVGGFLVVHGASIIANTGMFKSGSFGVFGVIEFALSDAVNSLIVVAIVERDELGVNFQFGSISQDDLGSFDLFDLNFVVVAIGDVGLFGVPISGRFQEIMDNMSENDVNTSLNLVGIPQFVQLGDSLLGRVNKGNSSMSASGFDSSQCAKIFKNFEKFRIGFFDVFRDPAKLLRLLRHFFIKWYISNLGKNFLT
jgi:hypothetical protein